MVQKPGTLLLCISTSALLACAPLSDETTAHQYEPSATHFEADTGCCKQTRPSCGLNGSILHCDSLD